MSKNLCVSIVFLPEKACHIPVKKVLNLYATHIFARGGLCSKQSNSILKRRIIV